MSPQDTYQDVTNRILAALEDGVAPWHMPWSTTAAYNVRTKRPYRGINSLLLAIEGRSDPRWGTFKAWREAGGSVRKGEHGTHIVLWKRQERKQSAEEIARGEEPSSYAFMRSYVVFNAEQCDNIAELESGDPFEPIERAEEIIRNMPNPPEIGMGGNRAFYRPSDDFVGLPWQESFESPAAFYVTAFHELTHATGSEKRLGGLEPATFGSDPYAREELVAELGAAFLAGSAELEFSLESSAAYLEGWRSKLSRDPKLIVKAASEAQRRSDYILGISWKEGKQETRELVAA